MDSIHPYQRIIKRINKRAWWRTAINENAIQERGIFFASSFSQAEFYGRPVDEPFKVNIKKPLVGDEAHVMTILGLNVPDPEISIPDLLKLEALKMKTASSLGFDSIAIMTSKEFKNFLMKGRLPNQYELQVFP